MAPVTLESLEDVRAIRNKVGVVLGLPMGRQTVRREWALAMMSTAWPLNISVLQSVVADYPVAEAREMICEQAIVANAPYVWFVDDDTVPPSAAIRMLLYELEKHPEAAAIGGIYCSRGDDTPSPMVFKDIGIGAHWDWKVGEVFEVGAIGTGCLLIRTEALKTLPKPWFRTVDIGLNGLNEGTAKIQMTDDFYFSSKLTEGGYKILAHGGVLCQHWDMDTQKCYVLPADSRPYQT